MSILNELKIKGIINAAGTLTKLGGAILSDEVINAMKEISKIYVDMEELHKRAGEFIANLLGIEGAYITSGAAAGLVLCTAACITEGDIKKAMKLPNARGMKNELLIQSLHRNIYDYVVTLAGAKLIEIGRKERITREELEKKITKKTCGVLYVAFDPLPNSLSLKEVIEVAHRKGLPVIVDAAAELPPVENLKKFVQMSADMVVFSGGKDIGAPNDTGVILGKKKWIEICYQLGPQSYKVIGDFTRIFIGRPMKVSKEDIAGFVAAFKKYLSLNHEERLKKWKEKAILFQEELSKIKGIKVRIIENPGIEHPRPACIPKVELEFEFHSVEFVKNQLIKGNPPIYVYTINNKLYINPQCLRDGEERIIIDCLKRIILSS